MDFSIHTREKQIKFAIKPVPREPGDGHLSEVYLDIKVGNDEGHIFFETARELVEVLEATLAIYKAEADHDAG